MLALWEIAEAPHGTDVPDQGTAPQVITHRFASHDFVADNENETAEFIPGRIARGLQITRSVNQGQDGMLGGLVTADVGEIEFGNPDGALDSLLDAYPDGRPVRIKVGFSHQDVTTGREIIDAYEDFNEVFIAVAGSWQLERDTAVLRLRDPGLLLQANVAKSRYLGTGDEEGNADLGGKSRPSALGHVFNAEPQLLVPGYLIYQVHGGPVQSIDVVYDAGVELAFDADYASYKILLEALVPAGEYATCIARGYIKLGASPTGKITVDLHGDAGFPEVPWGDDEPWDDDDGWVSGTGPALLAGHVALKILLEYARISYLDIDELSFTTVDSAVEREVGIYIGAGEARTIESVLSDIGISSGVIVGTNKMGKFAAFRLDLNLPPAFTFTANEITDIHREPLPYGVPWFEWLIGYQKVWTVQSGTELAGAATVEHRQFVGQEFRQVTAHSSHIKAAHHTSRPAPRIESVLTQREHAQIEAKKRLAFYGLGRSMFRVTVKNALLQVEIGIVVTLQLDRFGLDSGLNFVVVGVSEDVGSMTTTLACFG